MPAFCRHNRFVANCPICREPEVGPAPRRRAPGRRGAPRRSGAAPRASGLQLRRAARSEDDGYRSGLAPGLRASADAIRLARELAFAAGRVRVLRDDPPGAYGEVASEPDLEEALWLAFLIAYLGPLEATDDPFAGVALARTAWGSGEARVPADVPVGPRGAHEAGRGSRTLAAYRAWAQRAGSQGAALRGDPGWTPQRRFARAFERLALPGLHRAARFDLLTTLGALGRLEGEAASLFAAGDETTLAAKRVFGIADPLLLDRRATALAAECDVPLAALDLALFNWGREGERYAAGVAATDLDAAAADRARRALGVAG